MMPETAPAPPPLAIDRVERSRAKNDHVRLRLNGRWLGAAPDHPEALLVVQMHGRRHRFPPAREEDDRMDAQEPGGPFAATFTVPDWAVPEHQGQAVLWIGDAVVSVPPPGTRTAHVPHPALAPDDPLASRAGPTPQSSEPSSETPDRSDVAAEPLAGSVGRSGPLVDVLLKETVSALHAELEQRATEAARLRGALAEVRTELEGRAEDRSGLEAAHAELREELSNLTRTVGRQRTEFEARMQALREERDAARADVQTAVAERDGVRGELQAACTERDSARNDLQAAADERDRVREQVAAAESERDGAHRERDGLRTERDGLRTERDGLRTERDGLRTERDGLRTERDALGEELSRVRAESDQRLATVRAEAEADLAAARREVDAETVSARAETEAMLGAARAQSDARAQAAEAQAQQLTDRLSAVAAGERGRAQEAATLREQLASAQVSRDAALGEATGLRAELERIGSELATLREQGAGPGGDVVEARQLLADARALADQLRGDATS